MALSLTAQAAPPAVGQPLALKFTTASGKHVDLAEMKGKVVLIDFWATWCGPCVKEVPHVVEAYGKYHDKGFEIVGISLDSDKSALSKFIKEHGMAWPQYFDGKGWENVMAKRFGIHSVPSMWLVDKQGNLVTTNARADLDGQIEKLLGP